MPLATSWVEELVAEYFMLKACVVLVDYPIGTGERGGRRDVDVVAVSPAERTIYLIDVKGAWTASASDLAKDIEERLNEAENIFKQIYGNDYRYLKMAIIIGESSKPAVSDLIDKLRSKGIEARDLVSLIKEIADYIDEWKKQQQKRVSKRTTDPTCPGNLYLIKLLEYLKAQKLLKTKQT